MWCEVVLSTPLHSDVASILDNSGNQGLGRVLLLVEFSIPGALVALHVAGYTNRLAILHYAIQRQTVLAERRPQ